MARPIPADPVLAQAVEDVYVEYFSYLRGAPCVEVHCDSDLVWKVSPRAAWSKCGVGLRAGGAGREEAAGRDFGPVSRE